MIIKNVLRTIICLIAFGFFMQAIADGVQPKTQQQMLMENIQTDEIMKDKSQFEPCLFNPHTEGKCEKCQNWCKTCEPKTHPSCIAYGCDGCK